MTRELGKQFSAKNVLGCHLAGLEIAHGYVLDTDLVVATVIAVGGYRVDHFAIRVDSVDLATEIAVIVVASYHVSFLLLLLPDVYLVVAAHVVTLAEVRFVNSVVQIHLVTSTFPADGPLL
jgi:hypothetical protein